MSVLKVTESNATFTANSITNGVLYLEPHNSTPATISTYRVLRSASLTSFLTIKQMFKTTRVHATAMQCAIATCISSVQTSFQSHQPCTVASRNALTALKCSWAMVRRAPTPNPKDQVPEQGRLAPEGRVCNQKLMARQHAKRHGGHRTLPNVLLLHLTTGIWKLVLL